MKISAAPQFTPNRVPNNNKPSVPTPPKPDQVELGGGQPSQEPKVSHSRIAVAGASMLGGAALGAVAGLHGGLAAEALAMCTIPALAVGGAILGGIAFEKFGPSSSEYRAIGGGIVGAALGAGAGIAQSFLAGTGSPVLAATLGVSGALMGAVVWFKASSTPPPAA